ncbi:MAG TPA: RtcB family protein [Steroidobacteraceae bacterium]|nr:RtcB family protein [Steroidobacteraceae bacterium]
MPVRRELAGGRVPVRIFTEEVEPEALQQLEQLAQLPFIHGHVAAMPDVHYGIGASVGTVIPTRGAIIPAAVGVDIGCGMGALRLTLRADELPDSLRSVRAAIESRVPLGFEMHEAAVADKRTLRQLEPGLRRIYDAHPALEKRLKKPHETWARQLGSLGGGNHFIELNLDQEQRVWVMLHSGSRGIGNALGTYFIELARRDMQRHLAQLPHRDLAYFEEGAQHFDEYVSAVHWAQEYASRNRQELMRLVLEALRRELPPFEVTDEAINCHHNYVAIEEHFDAQVFVTRKGAISARAGELGIIPGSMGAKSYIVRGKGNAQSLHSCAHGAGRRMSRAQARKRFRRADLEQQTAGVECRKDSAVLDEIPAAYKDIDAVMANQGDLVEVVHTLKQVVCVKG